MIREEICKIKWLVQKNEKCLRLQSLNIKLYIKKNDIVIDNFYEKEFDWRIDSMQKLKKKRYSLKLDYTINQLYLD